MANCPSQIGQRKFSGPRFNVEMQKQPSRYHSGVMAGRAETEADLDVTLRMPMRGLASERELAIHGANPRRGADGLRCYICMPSSNERPSINYEDALPRPRRMVQRGKHRGIQVMSWTQTRDGVRTCRLRMQLASVRGACATGLPWGVALSCRGGSLARRCGHIQ